MTVAGAVSRVDADLLATVQALFPEAALELGRGGGETALRFVPGVRRARMLVPADAPRAAAGAVDRPSAVDSRSQVLLRGAVGALLRMPPLASMVMPHVLRVDSSTGSLLEHLHQVTGREVRFSLAIGSRRANRKPVLNVHALDGAEIGYAKVGLTTLANTLIDHEAAMLASLAAQPPRSFRAPRPIHHGHWRTSSVLLMESLRPSAQQSAAGVPLAAIAELVARDGLVWRRLGESAWLERIAGAGAELTGLGRPGLSAVTERYRRTYGQLRVPLGHWHGDLGPWNMAWEGQTALVWDWERAEPDVPAALDAVHFTSHSVLRDVGNAPRARQVLAGAGTDAVRAVLRRLPEPVGEDVVRGVVLGYLLSVAARFSADATRPDGEAVGRLADWHLAVLNDLLDHEE